jgi:predicted porin
MNHIHRKLYPLASIAAGVVTLAAALPASAIDLTNADGTWKFSLNGNVNVDYIYSNCETASSAKTITAGLACTGNASGNSFSNIGNGLLPAAFAFGVSTTQAGIDLAAHLGMFPGIATNDGGSPNLQASGGPTNTGLGTTGLDLRQVYMTFGNKDMGTFTLGRNFGLFGFDAIINDMTLIGVGVAGSASGPSPANTTLGSIGFGYIYVDTLAQMDYTTPDFSGANLTVGIFDPLNSLTEPGAPAAKSAPGFHAKIAWSGKFADDMKLSLSATGIEQKQDYLIGPTTAGSFQSVGGDVFAKLDLGGLSLMASGYDGKGMGTTGLFFNADDGHGNGRESYGYLLQGTYTVAQVKFGVNYGVSRLAYANAADRVAVGNLLADNSKWTGGVYYSLTKNLTLLGEVSYVDTWAHNESLNGAENKSTNFNVGAFLAF